MAKEDLAGVVENFISESGWALEMKVGHCLLKCGLHPFQAVYYPDVVSGEEREIDLVATRQAFIARKNQKTVLFKISLAIQCKWSRQMPWAIFCEPQKESRSAIGALVKTIHNAKHRPFITALSQDVSDKISAALIGPSACGYGMTTVSPGKDIDRSARGKSKDLAYEAYRSVISGSLGILRLAAQDTELDLDVVHVVIPVIIVDGLLFFGGHRWRR